MKLEEYIENHKIDLVTFAKKSKVSYTTLRNLIVLGRDVRGSVLMKLEKVTWGLCTAQQIYADYVKHEKKDIEEES